MHSVLNGQRALHKYCPVISEFGKKTAIEQAEQDPNLPARQVMFWVESSQCNSSLFNRVAGQVEVAAGQNNFRDRMHRRSSNVLEPMLHPPPYPQL